MILRLRQVCTHPDLVFTMFENDDSQTTGRDTEATQNACSILFLYSNDCLFQKKGNPIFHRDQISTKMKYILIEMKILILSLKEKIVRISKWKAMKFGFPQDRNTDL
jgi:hypothetical protein